MKKQKRIVIKVGSNVLTRNNGMLDIARLSSIVSQIAELHERGIEVILISSGAVAAGKNELDVTESLDNVSQRQLFSSVGQAKLINHYYDLFREYGICVGQILTTKEDFSTRHHYLNQRNCISIMLKCGVIPIVNENDTIAIHELMFTDNDELSGLIASMMNANSLFILSNIDGIYNGDPNLESTSVVRKIDDNIRLSKFIQPTKSGFGRGGMLTKVSIARKIAREGISVVIANGMIDGIIIKLVQNENVICTKFIARKKSPSNIKKWMAHTETFVKGSLSLNEKTSKILQDNSKIASLLPIGILKVEGNFEKDDIIELIDYRGNMMGVGMVRFSSSEIDHMKGKHHMKPVVHYDYLYIENG